LKIEILCTGDEVLTGKTVNSNYSHIARRLFENGLEPHWGTTVGDDRESLVKALLQAARRADAVIVNGGLGPTVDDLSQEVAASAAGVGLELNQAWLNRIRRWYESNGRQMPENNTKQAMLPEGAEMIDNPIGTACGFALDIHGSRFFFTPGVPRELYRMLDEQILPRLQSLHGRQMFSRVKRFHTFGIGESRADRLLEHIEAIDAEGVVKLGFQSHFPQLETKLSVRLGSEAELDTRLAPVIDAVRDQIGAYILCEDDESLEDVIINGLNRSGATLSLLEAGTLGSITGRLLGHPDGHKVIKPGLIANSPVEICRLLQLEAEANDTGFNEDYARHAAVAVRRFNQAALGMAVLMQDRTDRPNGKQGKDVFIAISNEQDTALRKAVLPGRAGWTRLGAAELACDCLRRFLANQAVYERIDFEQH